MDFVENLPMPAQEWRDGHMCGSPKNSLKSAKKTKVEQFGKQRKGQSERVGVGGMEVWG
jgi:hypothetical protein